MMMIPESCIITEREGLLERRASSSGRRRLLQSSMDEHDSVAFTYAGSAWTPRDVDFMAAREDYNRMVGDIIHRTASNVSDADKEWARVLSSHTNQDPMCCDPAQEQQRQQQAEVHHHIQEDVDMHHGSDQIQTPHGHMREPEGLQLQLCRTTSTTEDNALLDMVPLLGSSAMGSSNRKILAMEHFTPLESLPALEI
jgi:hypothetical protein